MFYTPVHAQTVTTIWENCEIIMESEVCVATPLEHCTPVEHGITSELKQINVIMVHDVELKSAHYLYIQINQQLVKIK